MPEDRSRPSDRGTEFKAEHLHVSERIKRLEEAINELEGVKPLRPDAAARLVKYRESHDRLQFQRKTLEWEMRAHPIPETDSPVPPGGFDDAPVSTVADEMLKQAQKKNRKKRRGWLRS